MIHLWAKGYRSYIDAQIERLTAFNNCPHLRKEVARIVYDSAARRTQPPRPFDYIDGLIKRTIKKQMTQTQMKYLSIDSATILTEQVASAVPADNGTEITLKNGQKVTVSESYEEVSKAIKEAQGHE